MKKFFLLGIAGLGVITGVYALLPSLFPDTSELPRVPTASGTIGYALNNTLSITNLSTYIGDGTVSNTLKLFGRTATGYLHTSPDCPPTQVYGGIDTTGNAICRAKSLLLTQVGRIVSMSGIVMVYHASGSSTLVSSLPYIIMNGDIIDTDPSGAADIIFSDDSLLSLADDTTLELQLSLGASSEPIASVILASGNIWGRVLTSTGVYNVGDASMVAGVRGTSFQLDNSSETITGIVWNSTTRKYAINRSGAYLSTRLTLAHTMSSSPMIVTCQDGSTHPLNPRQIMTGNLMTCTPPSTMSIGGLYADTQIRDNSKRDIRYLQTLVTLSGSPMTLHGGAIELAKLSSELLATIPVTPLEILSLCSIPGEIWFPQFGCQPSSLLAIADYTQGDYNLYVYNGVNFTSVPPINPASFSRITSTDYFANGAGITSTGQYISYPIGLINSLLGSTLAGKTVEISVQNRLPISGGTLQYLLDFVGPYLYYNGGPYLSHTLDSYTFSLDRKTFSFIPGMIPGSFIIGNNSTTYSRPIINTIKSIKIK